MIIKKILIIFDFWMTTDVRLMRILLLFTNEVSFLSVCWFSIKSPFHISISLFCKIVSVNLFFYPTLISLSLSLSLSFSSFHFNEIIIFSLSMKWLFFLNFLYCPSNSWFSFSFVFAEPLSFCLSISLFSEFLSIWHLVCLLFLSICHCVFLSL